jgi:hypothetical protein
VGMPHRGDPRLERVAQHNAVPNRSLRYDLEPWLRRKVSLKADPQTATVLEGLARRVQSLGGVVVASRCSSPLSKKVTLDVEVTVSDECEHFGAVMGRVVGECVGLGQT